MSQIQIFDYNQSQIQFEVVNSQVMANATLMCQAFGKKPVKWLELESTKRYLSALEAKSEIRTLVETRQGGVNAGTWVHEKLILKLAQWLDVGFELWCDEKIAELLRTGVVTTAESDDELLSRALVLANSKLANMQTRLVQAERTIELQAPKVEYVDAVLNSDGCMNTTEIAAEFSWSARRLNLELQRMGVQYKTNGHWVLTHKYREHEQRTGQKYTETRTILTESKSTGEVKSRIDRVWTQRGRALIWWLIKQDAAMKQKALGAVE